MFHSSSQIVSLNNLQRAIIGLLIKSEGSDGISQILFEVMSSLEVSIRVFDG